MNFIVSSTQLLNHLQSVSRVISSKNTMAILDNFLFELNDNMLKITASDVETTMTTTFEVSNSAGGGSVAIDAKRLLSILKEFSEQPLTFNIDDSSKNVDIVSQNGKFSVLGQNGEDFPQVQSLQDGAYSVELTTDALLQGVSKTLFATSTDEYRPVMTGIFVELSQGKVKFVATDAHKLVCYTRTDVKIDNESSFILPPKPANLLKGILPKDDGSVSLTFDSKNAVVKFNDYTLICRLIEGNYPNYQAVIPTDAPRKLTVERASLCNCLRRVSVCSNQASNLIKLSLTPNQLTVSAQDIDFSVSAHERVQCQYEGEDMEMGFKSSYLIEILSNLNCNDVVVNLSNPLKPGTFIPLDKSTPDEDVLMLLCPIQI
ncbi:MAG: DNA polymerase III subunit beta [Salinivirgaceae bacterium]|nr:DNA polymerase III subunit beta [Salinivirgaceae bacterium]